MTIWAHSTDLPRRAKAHLLASAATALVLAIALPEVAYAQTSQTVSADVTYTDFGGINNSATHTVTINQGATATFNVTANDDVLFSTVLNGAAAFNVSGGQTVSIGAVAGPATLTGSGDLIKNGSGVFYISRGAGAGFTGNVVVNQGELSIGDSGSLGTLASFTIAAGVSLETNFDETLGALSGSGEVRIHSDDTLQVGANNSSTTFGGTIRRHDLLGAAITFQKIGTGNLTLTGTSFGAGDTFSVQQGTLTVDGVVNASGNVLAGATLAGSGTVGTTLVHGTLSPGSDGGNALGTLSLAAVGFTPGSIFRVGIDGAGQSDRLVITGNGSVLDGTVQVDARAGTYAPNQQYTILQVQNGGTYSNRFAGVTSNYAFLSPVLSYNAAETEVYLTLTMGGTVGFSRVAFTPNQFAVATATERLGFGQQVFDAVAVLTAEDARTAFDALSGEMNASATGVANGDVQAVQGAVLNRLRSGPVASPQALAALSSAVAAYSADLSTRRGVVATPVSAPAATVSLWGQAIGSRGELEGDSNAASLDRRTGGLVIGADMGFEGRWRAGFAGAWSRSKADLGARLSSAEIDTYSGTLYGATQFGALALRGGLTYAHHEVDTTRTILFPGYSGATSSNRSGHSWQAFSEVGYGLQLASFAVEPFAGLAHVSTDLGGYQEVGNTAASNAAALAGHGSDLSLTYASLGVRVAMPFGALTARAGLSWRHAFGDVVPTTTQAFAANPAVPFTVSGTPVARDTLAVETGLDWAMSRNVALGVSYDGQFANRAQEHALKGDLKVRF